MGGVHCFHSCTFSLHTQMTRGVSNTSKYISFSVKSCYSPMFWGFGPFQPPFLRREQWTLRLFQNESSIGWVMNCLSRCSRLFFEGIWLNCYLFLTWFPSLTTIWISSRRISSMAIINGPQRPLGHSWRTIICDRHANVNIVCGRKFILFHWPPPTQLQGFKKQDWGDAMIRQK